MDVQRRAEKTEGSGGLQTEMGRWISWFAFAGGFCDVCGIAQGRSGLLLSGDSQEGDEVHAAGGWVGGECFVYGVSFEEKRHWMPFFAAEKSFEIERLKSANCHLAGKRRIYLNSQI